jgi:serine/threonine protein kinase
MADLFNKIVKEHFEPLGFKVSKLSKTRHWNVLRLYDPSDKTYYVAKGILHIDGNDEMGPKQMNKAYNNESTILSKLPDWWGLYLKDSFKEDPFRIIVTPEIPNCKWSGFKGNDTVIAKKIYKQIEWLHSNKIAHNDLELKNVLLTCDNKNAIIIDFEKATKGASNSVMRNDYQKIINSLNNNDKTKGIATKLEKLAIGKLPLTRRLSIGGKFKYKTRKNRKY